MQPLPAEQIWRQVFPDWPEAEGAAPVWAPTAEQIEAANITQMQRSIATANPGLNLSEYRPFWRWSVSDRERFWAETIQRLGICFDRAPRRVLDLSPGLETPDWLPQAQLNIVASCFAAEPGAAAIIFDAPDGAMHVWSYGELRSLSGRVAAALTRGGLRPGDGVGVVMPMTPESVGIYLGIIQAGCVVVSIADSFAPAEIAARLRIGQARAVFTMDQQLRGGKALPLLEKVAAPDAPPIIVLKGADGPAPPARALRPIDRTWEQFINGIVEQHEPIYAGPDHPINILFSSGTTGEPKAIVWDQTTPIKCAADGFYHHDLHPGDVVAWPSNLGWMMGPWLIFAALINRCAIALHHDAPLGRGFGQFIERAGVTMLGVVPSLVRRWRETGCMEGLNWRRIRAFSSTGECSNPDDMRWLMRLAGNRPIIEYCGGTEIGGGYIASTVVQPNIPSTFSTPALGSDFVILNEQGQPADNGELFLIPPAVGLSRRLLNRDHHEVYYAGLPRGPEGQILRRHGDQVQRLPGGYYRHVGRADDAMNLGGIKVASAEIERVLATLPGVEEVAAVAATSRGGGPSRLVIFAVLRDAAAADSAALQEAMQQQIRRQLNPLFRISEVRIVAALPRTASNKVMRRMLRDSM